MDIECGNCGHAGAEKDFIPLEEVKDLNQRLDAGSEVPAGECRECGALAYLVKQGRNDGSEF